MAVQKDDILNAEIFADFADLMGESLSMILERYSEMAEEYLRTIKAALGASDFTAIMHAAHPFKSSSQQIGALKVAGIAREIEKLSTSAPDTRMLNALYEQLHQAYRATSEALAPYLEGSAP